MSKEKVNTHVRGDLYHYLNFIDTGKTCTTSRSRLGDRPLTTGGFLANRREILGSLSLSTVNASTCTKDTDLPIQSPVNNVPQSISGSQSPSVLARKTTSMYSQIQPVKKKIVVNRNVIDADKIRKKCMKDFPKSWTSAEVIGGFAERNKAVQLMDDEPIRFWSKDIVHEDYNEKFKHFEEYDRIRAKAKLDSKR